MEVIEWLGVITGILAVYFLYQNKILTWPVGYLNIICFMIVFWQQKLYGDFIVQIIFLLVGVWGWINWKHKSLKQPGELAFKFRILWITGTLASVPITVYYLKTYTDCSYPIAEALILNLSISGQWLTAMRKIENWYFWLAADFLMTVVYSLKGLYPTAIYASIIFIIGYLGLKKWKSLILKRP